MKEYNGYDFNDKKTRKRMKYIVIFRGDLDLNGAYSFTNKKELKAYLKDTYKDVEAVFKVRDITV